MNPADFEGFEPQDEPTRPSRPHRKSSGPGRERKQKSRRTSKRKQGGAPVGGIHRRGSSTKRGSS